MENSAAPSARKRYSSDLSAQDWQRLEPLLQVRRVCRPKTPAAEQAAPAGPAATSAAPAASAAAVPADTLHLPSGQVVQLRAITAAFNWLPVSGLPDLPNDSTAEHLPAEQGRITRQGLEGAPYGQGLDWVYLDCFLCKLSRVTFRGLLYLLLAARAAANFHRAMISPANPWPLPGQIDPNLTPCAFCRRRLRIGGKPVFASCSCKAFGPPVTVAALVAGALAALGGGIWWLGRRRK